MKNILQKFSIPVLGVSALASACLYTHGLYAQNAPPPTPAAPAGGGRGAVNLAWATSRGDAQRSGWVRSDSEISVENLRNGGFGVEWTVKVGHTPGEILSAGVGGNTAQLDPAPGDIAGSGNNIYTYEVDQGAIVWTKHFDVPARSGATASCPGGLTSGVARMASLTGGVTGLGPGRAGGGRTTYQSIAGSGPGQGVPLPFRAGVGVPQGGIAPAAAAAMMTSQAALAAAAAAPPPAPRPFSAWATSVYLVSGDGVLHTLGQQTGVETRKPAAFLPAKADARHLTVINQMAYVTTVNNCGGVSNGVWAMDMAGDNAVKSWKSGASPVGDLAFSSSGVIYVALGSGPAGADSYSDAVVALDPATLTVKDWFTAPGAAFSTSPVIFTIGAREMAAVASSDGRVFLLDAASLGGSDHRTALAVSTATNTSKAWSPSALATWEDSSGNRWIALPATKGKAGITAFRVSASGLQPGWTSGSDLAAPSAPIVVNDVVFALNQGSGSTPAVLYAMDASNGKEIWNSGKALKSAVASAGLWSISGQVHVITADNMLYSFARAQDRHP